MAYAFLFDVSSLSVLQYFLFKCTFLTSNQNLIEVCRLMVTVVNRHACRQNYTIISRYVQ